MGPEQVDPERPDLSALDPARDEARWESMVRRTAARGLSARRARSLGAQVTAWARPALALAAGIAVVAWLGALAGGAGGGAASADPALALAQWASADRLPETGDILSTLGGRDAAD